MPKISWSDKVKDLTKSFLDKLLSYVLENQSYLPLQYKWEDDDNNRYKLVIQSERRFLDEIAVLNLKDQFNQVKNKFVDLEIFEDRRFNKRGTNQWDFALKLWSKIDKDKNLIEFDKLWESKRPEKSKKSDNNIQKSPKFNENIFLQSELHGDIPYRKEGIKILPRDDQLNELKNLVLAGINQAIVITGVAYKVGVFGMGGIGKSFLTSMLVQDEEIQNAFPDGIFWLTLGKEPNLKLRQADLCKMLGDNPPIFQDFQQGRNHLRDLLKDKTCLLVIDDAWNSTHVEPFENILNSQSRMIITTRDKEIINNLQVQPFEVNLLDKQQAKDLLGLYLGHSENLPSEADEIVKECGYLPLALAMVGAILRDKPNRWENILNKLRNADLEKIKVKFPGYEHPNLFKAIQVSVKDLETETQQRYLDFAVFPEDTPIPEETLITFWKIESLDQDDSQDILDTRNVESRNKT